MEIQQKIEIIFVEKLGTERVKEPVTFGIPFPRRLLTDKNYLSLVGDAGDPISMQAEVLSTWPDKSIKWLLCDFQVDCPPNSSKNYYLIFQGSSTRQSSSKDTIRIDDSGSVFTIQTGKAEFTLDKNTYFPFKNIKISGHEIIDNSKSCVVLKDEKQREFLPVIKKTNIENNGQLRCTIKLEGQFQSDTGKVFADFFSRLFFYAGKNIVKIEFTIRNPKAAKHPGGLWDLGDEGSVYFDDLSFHFALPAANDSSIFYKTQSGQKEKKLNGNNMQIYQDSSGGLNWKSRNHVNRYGKVVNSFRGYKVLSNGLLEEGQRIFPTIGLVSEDRIIAAAIKDFWQNFPKSIETENSTLTLRLFPHQYKDVFELQGGEQKTHTIFIAFGANVNELINLDWTQEPLIPEVSSDWYIETGVFRYLTDYDECKNTAMQKMMDAAVKGENTFFNRREIIDEYGWRNFGDLYADHESEEAKKYKGEKPIISHYNNQYDVIYSTLKQYVKSGDSRWWELSSELADHVVDIDIYHTDMDRYQYSRGMFWHTDHFMDAATCTHRTFSLKNVKGLSKSQYGGGPGMAHNYTTGILYQYLMTGNRLYLDTLLELSQWTVSKVDGPESIKEIVKHNVKATIKTVVNMLKRNKGLMSGSSQDVPDRASGNCVSALIDFFVLTQNRIYLSKAEEVIKKCVNPGDNIEDRNLLNAEFNWSYTIFLQSLGKYLFTKAGIGEYDNNFNYAKDTLVKYAEWMATNEYPFLKKPELLDHPNYATRAAQDLRKAEVFLLASEYTSDNEMKDKFIQKARSFYDESLNSLLSLETRSLTRPLAILLQNSDILLSYEAKGCFWAKNICMKINNE